jgi:hypothetical protein
MRSRAANGGVTENTIAIMPGLDWFFSDRVSFGGTIGYFNQSTSRLFGNQRALGRTSGVVFAPRFGFDAVLGPSFSVYSKVALVSVFGSSKAETRIGPASEESASRLYLQLSSHVLGHFKGHLYAGFGPTLAYDINNHGSQGPTVNFGLSSVFGVWL